MTYVDIHVGWLWAKLRPLTFGPPPTLYNHSSLYLTWASRSTLSSPAFLIHSFSLTKVCRRIIDKLEGPRRLILCRGRSLGLHRYAKTIGFSEECLGMHMGNLHEADLGDGDGRKIEQFLARQHYFPIWGTCWESLRGTRG